MAKRNSGGYSPYSKRRIKNNKQYKQAQHEHLIDEIKNPTKKTWVYVIIVVIIIIMVASLILPYFVNQKSSNYSLPDTVLKQDIYSDDASYSPEYIVLGEVFTRQDKDYYVLIGSSSEIQNNLSLITSKTYYVVNTDEAINNWAINKNNKGAKLPSSPSQIKVSNSISLIHIKNGKAVSFVSGATNIKNSLK
ncbi:MAG: hypothetical protein LBR40_01975 [Bacilli bacterium]|jgi:hypothetical protein|nr:hypothetical protein [Bacilli bacterium]